jgi:hypothetical protein
MTELIAVEDIQNRIFKIRGLTVMLDRDLASLYKVRAIALRQQVKRNLERFPSDFAFQLTEAEAGLLVSQNVIPSGRSLGGSLPYVFTEEGVAMLSGVLRSSLAVQVNISIMRAFVKLRHVLTQNRDILHRVERIEGKLKMHDTDIRLLVQSVQDLKKKPVPSPELSPQVRGFDKPD